MDIEFICEHCGGVIKVQDYLGGQQIECYHCHGGVVVPMEGEKAVIEFSCLGCGSSFRVPRSRAGSRTKCPKCDAALVVPGASTGMTPPASPTFQAEPPPPPPSRAPQDELPVSPSPFLRKHAALRARSASSRAGQAGAGEQDGYVPPPTDRTSVGMILFWVGLAAVFVVALIMFISRKDSGPGGGSQLPPLYANIKYNGIGRVFQVTSEMRYVINDAQFTLETTQGTFSTSRGSLSPNEAVTINIADFGGPGGSPGASAMPLKLTIRAQMPNGQRVERVVLIGGARSPASGSAPAPARPPQEPPNEEGGAVIE